MLYPSTSKPEESLDYQEFHSVSIPSSARDPDGTVLLEMTILASESLGKAKFGATCTYKAQALANGNIQVEQVEE